MASAKSTRLSIVEQSLTDILERLADLHPTEATVMKLRELRTKAFAYERTVKTWVANAPSEAQRQAMLKLVLELNVQVMELSKQTRDELAAPTTSSAAARARTSVAQRAAGSKSARPASKSPRK
jgi:hypothetical protein